MNASAVKARRRIELAIEVNFMMNCSVFGYGCVDKILVLMGGEDRWWYAAVARTNGLSIPVGG